MAIAGVLVVFGVVSMPKNSDNKTDDNTTEEAQSKEDETEDENQ